MADLEAGRQVFMRLGFDMLREAGRAVAFNEGDFVELRKNRSDGLSHVILESDALVADQSAVSARGSVDFLALVGQQPAAPAGRHPNGVVKLERVYIAVTDVAASSAAYARALGMPAPKTERGTVINADMAVFNFGGSGLTLAQPAGPGVAADALANRGPGPFQALYRTRSMEAAASWMAGHDVPPPARGTRNTGEQAMLVPPAHACGAYLGFVGMP